MLGSFRVLPNLAAFFLCSAALAGGVEIGPRSIVMKATGDVFVVRQVDKGGVIARPVMMESILRLMPAQLPNKFAPVKVLEIDPDAVSVVREDYLIEARDVKRIIIDVREGKPEPRFIDSSDLPSTSSSQQLLKHLILGLYMEFAAKL